MSTVAPRRRGRPTAREEASAELDARRTEALAFAALVMHWSRAFEGLAAHHLGPEAGAVASGLHVAARRYAARWA